MEGNCVLWKIIVKVYFKKKKLFFLNFDKEIIGKKFVKYF